MARSPELEAILQAWFDLENCAPEEQFKHKQRFDQLIDAAMARAGKGNISKRELMMALRDHYRDFSKAKHLELRQRLSRLK